jgi:hypothetical protein
VTGSGSAIASDGQPQGVVSLTELSGLPLSSTCVMALSMAGVLAGLG